jgi:hypothetical protein
MAETTAERHRECADRRRRVARIASLVSPQAGSSFVTANIAPLAGGKVTISADVPAGYTGTAVSFPLTVSFAPLPLNSPTLSFTIDKNLQAVDNLVQSSADLRLFQAASRQRNSWNRDGTRNLQQDCRAARRPHMG